MQKSPYRYDFIDSTGWRTVVGVAGDIRFRSLRTPMPTIYLPWRQTYTQGMFAVRSHSTVAALLPGLRRALHDVDPQVDIFRAQTMDELLAMGAVFGLIGALAGTRLLASLLYEVSPADPLTFTGACIVLVGIGIVAAYLPARRAMRADPMQALRME